MSFNVEQSSRASWMHLTGLAVGQGLFITGATHPLEVIKIWQQRQQKPRTVMWVFRHLYQEGGFRALYRGVHIEAARLCVSQVWKWPLIVYAPKCFASVGVSEEVRPFAVGSTFATIGTGVNFLPQRAKVLAATEEVSVQKVVCQGFKGIGKFWLNRMVHMSAFLLAQERLRKRYLIQNESLSGAELIKIGAITAVFVSAVGIPFDNMATLALAGEGGVCERIKKVGLSVLMRGATVQMGRLVIFNISSAFIFNEMRR